MDIYLGMDHRLVVLLLLLLWGLELQAERNYSSAGVPCETAKADIVMLVEGSNCILPLGFGNMKLFISELLRTMHIGPNSFQIGLTQFSTEPKTQWNLNTHRTKESLLKAINITQQLGGAMTNTGTALRDILHHSFKPTAGMRPDSKKVAILIIHGESHDHVRLPAKNLKDTGIEIYVIGVRQIDEWRIISSGGAGTYVYITSDLQFLPSIKNNLTHSLCHSASSTDSVRLVNGSSLCSGRLEVKTSQSNQIWSTVCEADFDQLDAQVVCREIGCGPPSVLQGTLYGEVEAPTWTAEFQCGGTESSLLDCRRSGSVRNTCSANKAVRLTCSEPIRLVGGASRCEGTLELKLRTWRPVNALGWTVQEAAAACRELDCGSLVSMGTKNDSSIRDVWEIDLSCLKSGYPLRECAEPSLLSSSQSGTILELVCSDLLVQPIISVSSSDGVTGVLQSSSAGVFQGSSFTISCSIQPQYPGGSFLLSFTSSNTTHSYAQPASNHSAHFLFHVAGPAHRGNYCCVYTVHVFSHNFSSQSRVLTLSVSDPTVFIIRLVVLLLSLLIFISVIYCSHKTTRGQQTVARRNVDVGGDEVREMVEEQEEAAL